VATWGRSRTNYRRRPFHGHQGAHWGCSRPRERYRASSRSGGGTWREEKLQWDKISNGGIRNGRPWQAALIPVDPGSPVPESLRHLFPGSLRLMPRPAPSVGRARARATMSIQPMQPSLMQAARGLAFGRHSFRTLRRSPPPHNRLGTKGRWSHFLRPIRRRPGPAWRRPQDEACPRSPHPPLEL
jgi:hypothetical protein